MADFLSLHGTQEIDWERLYAVLIPPIRRWVRSSGLWVGQENDKVEDIRSETVERTLVWLRDAELRGAVVHSIEALSKRIAYHYFLDLIRKEKRVIRLSELPASTPTSHEPMEDVILDAMFNERLFVIIAHAINNLRRKSKTALLIDLAKRVEIDQQPTPLLLALRQAGISLEDYQHLKWQSEAEQHRHVALLTYVYRKLANLDSVKRYVS